MKKFIRNLSVAVTLPVLMTSCAALFQGKVDMTALDSNSIASLSALVTPDDVTKQLDAPQYVFVSDGEFSDRIKLTWAKVPNASYYRIERAEVKMKDENGDFIKPEESQFEVIPWCEKYYGTTLEDVILTDPEYKCPEYEYGYFYRISAENPRMKFDPSDYKTTEEAATLLPPPTGVKASLGKSKTEIQIDWKKIENACEYIIYRKDNPAGSGNRIAVVKSNQKSYIDVIDATLQGKEFYYTVSARNDLGQTSVESSDAMGYTLKDGAPPSVQNVVVSKGTYGKPSVSGIEIKWDPVSGSNIKYTVFRTSSKDGTFKSIKKDLDGSKTSYTDTSNLEQNIFYYYYVQVTKDGVKGPFSESGPEDTNPAEGFILAPPSNIAISKIMGGASQYIISFSPAIGSQNSPADSGLAPAYDVYKYRIYYGDTQDSVWSSSTDYDISEFNYDSKTGTLKKTIPAAKYYGIKTILGGTEGIASDVLAPYPFAPLNVVATKGKYIEGVTAQDDSTANPNGVHPVKITWDLPEDGEAAKYDVYRSTKSNSGWTKCNTDGHLTERVYIDRDETRKPGRYYYYRVIALNSLDQGNNFSDVTKDCIGYGALSAEQYMREYNKTIMSSQKKLTLMHKKVDTDKLGNETAYGTISGDLKYNAGLAGLGARITMHYANYCDFYANGEKEEGPYFLVTGDTNTTASMDASGTMDGDVVCTGMYPGVVGYGGIKIKGGAAGGGVYYITREGFAKKDISYLIGNEN